MRRFVANVVLRGGDPNPNMLVHRANGSPYVSRGEGLAKIDSWAAQREVWWPSQP
jgi:hypothetical protein